MGITSSSSPQVPPSQTSRALYDPNPKPQFFIAPAPMIALYGPTRSGKTTIGAQISFSFPTYHQNGLHPVDNLGPSSYVAQQALKQIFYSMQQLIIIALDNEEVGKDGYMKGLELPKDEMESVMMYDLKGKISPLDESLADAIKTLWLHPNIKAAWSDKPKSIPDGSVYLFRNIDSFVGDYNDDDHPLFPVLKRNYNYLENHPDPNKSEADETDLDPTQVDNNGSTTTTTPHSLANDHNNHRRRQLLPISFDRHDRFWCTIANFPPSTISDNASSSFSCDNWGSFSILIYVVSLADYIYGPRIGPDGLLMVDTFQQEEVEKFPHAMWKTPAQRPSGVQDMTVGTLGLDSDLLRFKQFFDLCDGTGSQARTRANNVTSSSNQLAPSIFRGKKLHLVLNKLDLFEERLQTHPFQQYQSQYQGDGSTRSIIDFIKYRFSSVIPEASVDIILHADDEDEVYGHNNENNNTNDDDDDDDDNNNNNNNTYRNTDSYGDYHDETVNEYNLDNPHLAANSSVKIHVVSALSEVDIQYMTHCIFKEHLNKK